MGVVLREGVLGEPGAEGGVVLTGAKVEEGKAGDSAAGLPVGETPPVQDGVTSRKRSL